MNIFTDYDERYCRVWVPFEMKKEYKNLGSYKSIIEKAKAKNCSVCVFIGGDKPLTDTLYEFMGVREKASAR